MSSAQYPVGLSKHLRTRNASSLATVVSSNTLSNLGIPFRRTFRFSIDAFQKPMSQGEALIHGEP